MTTNEVAVETLGIRQQCVGDNSTQEPPSVVMDYQTLAIALPIALITIIIVTLLVIVGVIISLMFTVGKKSSLRNDIESMETSQTPLHPQTTILDNSALYGRPSLSQ